MNMFLPFLVEITVKATTLLGLAWIAGLLLKNRSAAIRHAMRVCALIAVLLLPMFSYVMPAWRWQGLPRFLLSGLQTARAGETPSALPLSPARAGHDTESVIPESPASGTISIATGRGIPTVTSNSQPVLEWSQVLTVIWLAGIVLIGLRLIISRWRLALLIRRAAVVHDGGWRSQVREMATLVGIRRSVALLQSQETEVPLTSGSWRPKIILSPDYLEWSWLRREAIVRHELAHVRRLDTLAQAICHLAVTMYWFHPLVWLTARTMREEREQACDDYVLAAGTKPSDYAQELLAIASGLRQSDFITALALARRSPLEGRVMALLNPAQRRGSISQSTALIIALLTLCVVLPLAAIQTADPQPNRTNPQAAAVAKPSPSTPSATEAKPAKPPKAPRAPAVPPPPATPSDPVAGMVEGVAGGVPGGIPGGVTGGVPAIEAAPPAPAAPAAPQELPQAAPPPPPVSAKPGALPKPAPIPAPAAIPAPSVAPVAPEVPNPPPAETAPAASKDEAARSAALAVVRAKVAAIRAQQGVNQAEIKALKARIAEEVRAVTRSKLSDTATLRAESKERAAAIAMRAAEIAVVRAQAAAIRAATSQIKATAQKTIEDSISPTTSPAPAGTAPAKP